MPGLSDSTTGLAYGIGLQFQTPIGGAGLVGGAWTPAQLPSLVSYYNVSILSGNFVERTSPTTVTTVGGFIGTLRDQSTSALNLVTTVDAKRPVLTLTSSIYYALFDGTDDNLRMTTTLAQPMTRITAMQAVSWTINEVMLDGGATDIARVYQIGSTPTILVRGSAANIITPSPMPAVGEWFVIAEVYNGASSKVKINNNEWVTGNLGTSAPNGLTVGGRGDGAGAVYANMGFAGGVVTSNVMSDADVNLTIKYLGSLVGLSL